MNVLNVVVSGQEIMEEVVLMATLLVFYVRSMNIMIVTTPKGIKKMNNIGCEEQ